MKIDNSIKSSGQVSGENRTREARAAGTAPAQSGTQVALSAGLQKYEAVLAQSPVVDSAKVEEIKSAISNGSFSVNPEKVADGLIESVRSMLSAQPGAAA
ncbi:MAG: flagellar biosynthesis anti-sigma factor FlgM [Rhodocyclaceae bacterium]